MKNHREYPEYEDWLEAHAASLLLTAADSPPSDTGRTFHQEYLAWMEDHDDWKSVPKRLTDDRLRDAISQALLSARDLVMADENARAIDPMAKDATKESATEPWAGIHKVAEEMGELAAVLGKLNAFPEGDYPDDGQPLAQRLIEEITDVVAALDYFRQKNHVPISQMRYNRKMARFEKWGLSGIKA